MDIARPDLLRKRKIRRSLYVGVATVVVVLITVGVSRVQPAAPRVDRDTVYLDTVQRGPMVRQVRGAGTLVPEAIRWISATTEGTVERIAIRPGAGVGPDTVILELRNRELEQTALEAQLQHDAGVARYRNREVELESQLLAQRATLATIELSLTQAKLQLEADQQLLDRGLVSQLVLKQSQARAQEFKTRYELEQERLRIETESVEARLAVEQADVDSLRALWRLRVDQVADLKVRAPVFMGSSNRCRSTRANASRRAPTWPAWATHCLGAQLH